MTCGERRHYQGKEDYTKLDKKRRGKEGTAGDDLLTGDGNL